jgi:glutamate dehydrogenase (NAD(P)+)
MVNSFKSVVDFADKFKVNTRQAAYMLGIDRVAYDTRLRGIYA